MWTEGEEERRIRRKVTGVVLPLRGDTEGGAGHLWLVNPGSPPSGCLNVGK